jgi:pimeloyl-ACP methyl ester carboxylesterase
MTRVLANGIEIEYETSGSGEPLLLIMGLGGQLTDWHPHFVDQLADQFQVIRFDNRDIGLSTHSDATPPTRWQLIKTNLRPASVHPPYELSDMADDTAGLLDALDIPSAHVVGMSMGGMIAQSLALQHPHRVKSLCSIMSNTGDRRSGRPTAKVLRSLARRGQPDQTDALAITIDLFRLIGGLDWDEAEQRRRTEASLERAYNPAGVLRQAQVISAAPDRTEMLAALKMPALVVHGLDDSLVRPSGGIATAKAIPSSRLVMFPRMGHDIPATRQPEIVEAIRINADRVDKDRADPLHANVTQTS